MANTEMANTEMANTEVVIEPGQQDIVVTRVFDAPRDVVFKAYTDPALIPTWWGSGRGTTRVDHMEVRTGGQWRFVERIRDDTEYACRGVYHDVVAPERIVTTFEFESGGPGQLQLVVDTFDEVAGRTRLTSVSLFRSVADRDGWVPAEGLEDGIRRAMDRLAELVQTLG